MAAETPTRTAAGTPKVHISTKPFGTQSYFFGAGDNGGELSLKLTKTDFAKTTAITFNETIYMKDGYVYRENAPFGAYLTIEFHLKNPLKVITLLTHIPLWGSGILPFQTDDNYAIVSGTQFVVTAYNSDGIENHDPPANFSISCYGKAYREKTEEILS